MHRVRVPAARDAVEKSLAEAVKMTARHLNERGKLPPSPRGLSYDHLESLTNISDDPHRSIHAMPALAVGLGRVIDAIGFEILHNETDEDFITSDNPVVYFDPTVSETHVEPCRIDPRRMDIEMMFPITPRLMLWGHTILKENFLRRGVPYKKVQDKNFIIRANKFTARFGYRYIFAKSVNYLPLVQKFANRSPILKVTHIRSGNSRAIIAQSVFGKREPKPKWTGHELRGHKK